MNKLFVILLLFTVSLSCNNNENLNIDSIKTKNKKNVKKEFIIDDIVITISQNLTFIDITVENKNKKRTFEFYEIYLLQDAYYPYYRDKKNDCLYYFDSLPYLRKQDAILEKYVHYREILKQKTFNRMIRFINKPIPDDIYYKLIYYSYIAAEYGLNDLQYFYSKKEEECIWTCNENFYFKISDNKKIENYIYDWTLESSKNPWIESQKKQLESDMKKELEIHDEQAFYCYSIPDYKFFKLKRERNGYLTYSSYVNWQYKWLHPFRFFYIHYRQDFIPDSQVDYIIGAYKKHTFNKTFFPKY